MSSSQKQLFGIAGMQCQIWDYLGQMKVRVTEKWVLRFIRIFCRTILPSVPHYVRGNAMCSPNAISFSTVWIHRKVTIPKFHCLEVVAATLDSG